MVAPEELIPTARALARSYIDETAPVSIALIRQMMWRMLGASHPMEAHRIDSKAMFHRGRARRREGGHHVVPGKAPGRFTDTVSRDLPDLPWGEEPTYR